MTPKLTIVTPTYNAASDLPRFFAALKKQTIQSTDYEILVVDGGSTDSTVEIAKKYGARVLSNPKKLAEPGVFLGCQEARGKLIMVLAVDNIFPDSTAVSDLVDIFDDTKIAAVFPKHESGPDDSVYSRYINTFTDPFTHFVYGSAANARTFNHVYRKIFHTDSYDIFDYRSGLSYPLIALAQGFTVRAREVLRRTGDIHDDVLTVYDLIDKGKHIAYAHSVRLYHYTAGSLNEFIRKQVRAIENAFVRKNSGIRMRDRYLTFGQKTRIYLFFPYALSLLFPLIISIVKYLQTKHRIWLLHWYMVFISLCVITVTTITLLLRKIFR